MTTRYSLSARQLKELAERGTRLRIALPLPDDWSDSDSARDSARIMLAAVDPAWVVQAEVVEVPVQVTGCDRTCLAQYLGQIWHGDDASGNLQSLLRFELGSLAHNAQNGEAGGAGLDIEIGQAVDRGGVERTIGVEGRGGDSVNAVGLRGQGHWALLRCW